jgi:glucose-1-phosphate cytidylyltransferase
MCSTKKIIPKTAVVLCGGKGSRLGSLSKKLPKSLLHIKNKPIIWYILRNLKKNGFNHFILPIGYKGKLISNYINKSNEFKNYDIDIVNTGVNTPISHRIYKIKNLIKSPKFLLLNGDAIFDFNLKKIFKNHYKLKKNLITFFGTHASLPYGTLTIKNGLVQTFKRNVVYDSVIHSLTRDKSINYIYSGMAIIKSELLTKKILNYENFELGFYSKIIKQKKCKFSLIDGFWYSIDSIKDLSNLKNYKNKIAIDRIVKKLQ